MKDDNFILENAVHLFNDELIVENTENIKELILQDIKESIVEFIKIMDSLNDTSSATRVYYQAIDENNYCLYLGYDDGDVKRLGYVALHEKENEVVADILDVDIHIYKIKIKKED